MFDPKICREGCYECNNLKKIDAKDENSIYYCKEKDVLAKIFLPDDELKEKSDKLKRLIYPYVWYKSIKKELNLCEKWLKEDKLKKLEILDRYNKSRQPKSIEKKATSEDPKPFSLEDLRNKRDNIHMDLLMLYMDLYEAFKGKDVQLESFEEKVILHKSETTAKLEKLKKSMLLHDLSAVAAVPLNQVIKLQNSSCDIIPIGYVMENLKGWWKLSEILGLDFRRKNKISLKDISLIFLKVHHAIKMIHEKGFFIGNLSARNILVKPKKNWHSDNFVEIKIIKTDNWGINRPDIGLVWEPLAIDNEIIHPKRIENVAREKPALPFSQKEDWWSFAYLLSYCLLGFDPFTIKTTTIKDLDQSERVANRITALPDIACANRKDAIALVRIGSKMMFLLDLWLKCQIEGEFPAEVMLEFSEGIIRCKNPNCLMQFHKSISFCPNCKTII